MAFFHDHILSIILFIPVAGMVPLFLIPGENKQAIRWWGNVVLFVDFLASLPLVFWFSNENPAEQFKFIERHEWIPSIGAQYHLGIDGISFLLIMLTTVLGFLAVLSSWTAIQDRVKEYYAMFLLLQVGMLGVFMSLDFFLFYVFWEVMLVPMYFIIGVWGGPRKLYAAIKFFLYTLGWLRSDAARNPDALPQLHAARRQPHVRSDRTDEAHELLAAANAGLGLRRVRHRLRDQGADVPVPHLAAGCSRRGAHGGLGDPGGRFAEDGDVRLSSLLAAPSAPGQHQFDGRAR